MEFISNKNGGHVKRITEAILQNDTAYISVAFVKQSGIELLLPTIVKALKKGTAISIVAGQHFSLTEPKALMSLFRAMKGATNSNLYLANVSAANEVFHPKLYLFRTGHQGTIVCGSANITKGGLEDNTECSMLIRCSITDKVWQQAEGFFFELIKPENSEAASLLAIRRYESFYESQKALQKRVKAIPNRLKSQRDFNYANLLKHFKDYNNSSRETIFKEKQWHYKEARKVLDRIADDPAITQAKFIPLLEDLVSKAGEKGWWHSGSLFRKRRLIFPHYKAFQKLIQFIRQNQTLSPSSLFNSAKVQVDKIEGAGVNYIAEIMMTYNPAKFANLNKNPITVLRVEGDVHIKSSADNFTGEDYEGYCDLVTEICEELGLKNKLEADSFFNDIYWQIKNK